MDSNSKIMDNPRLKYWPVFFGVIFVEGIITLVWIGLIPPDAKNGVFLGFSLKRLLMMAFIIVLMALSVLSGWYSWRMHAWREMWLDPNQKPRLFHWLTVGALIIFFGLELALLFLRYYDPAHLSQLYIRFAPVLGYLLLACIQAVTWFLILRFGRGLGTLWRRSIFWIAGWAIISFLVYWALSPAGGGELHTWWYIQTFDPLRYERHGQNYCASDYHSSVESQYARANNIKWQLANIDRQKALLAIFDKVTKGAKTNTEKQLKILDFIQRSSYHTSTIASYSSGDWVYDPLVLLELGNMYCTQGAILAIDLFGAAGYPGRLVQLAHHQIAEIFYDGDWHYLDTDLFGNGETVLDSNGTIPSVAEMSRGEYQKMDAFSAYRETDVMDCNGPSSAGDVYPSYYYFSSQAYKTDVPQNYYMGIDRLYNFERGWTAVPKKLPNDIVVENDLPAKHTPTKPVITDIRFDPVNATLIIYFMASDPDNDLAGYQVFIADHSRGWDSNQFYGAKAARTYWANPDGWKPDMYARLFELPPSNLGLVKLSADKTQVEIPIKRGITYFITIMPFDVYGTSVGRVLYPTSNELKITVPTK